jgi:hypothetical protein
MGNKLNLAILKGDFKFIQILNYDIHFFRILQLFFLTIYFRNFIYKRHYRILYKTYNSHIRLMYIVELNLIYIDLCY